MGRACNHIKAFGPDPFPQSVLKAYWVKYAGEITDDMYIIKPHSQALFPGFQCCKIGEPESESLVDETSCGLAYIQV